MIALAENSYGKSSVRLMQVKRNQPLHTVREWKVEVLLSGDFTSCFTDGDNSAILPTDTMKNTVYSRARESTAECIEEFALELAGFFLFRNPQVKSVAINIASTPWEHAVVQGKPHASTFIRGSSEAQTTAVTVSQDGAVSVSSGIENLVLLKTAHSGFEDTCGTPSPPCRRQQTACLGPQCARNGSINPSRGLSTCCDASCVPH